MKTFGDYKHVLDPIVNSYIKAPFSKINGVEGLLRFKTDGLVPEKYLLRLLDFLNDTYESEENKIPVSTSYIFRGAKLKFSISFS